MLSLTIVFGPGPVVWTLMFKTEEAASNAKNSLCSVEGLTHIADDFGQSCTLLTSQIHGWMLENLDESKHAHIERALHQARTKITADKLAEADPVIREAARRQQGGMPMIQPMHAMPGPNGRFPS